MTKEKKQKNMQVLKYASNRKLYSFSDAKYTSVQEIAKRIKKGYNITVLHDATEEDVTNEVLLSVLLKGGELLNTPKARVAIKEQLLDLIDVYLRVEK